MKRRFVWWVAVVVLGMASQGAAMEYYVSGEALYWQPLTVGEDFGYTQSLEDPFVPDQVYANCPNYDWGGRVRAGTGCGRNFVEGGYLWFQSQASRTAVAGELPLIAPIFLQQFNSLTGRTEDLYQNAYLRVGRSLSRRCAIQVQGFAQVLWGYVKERREVSGFAPRVEDVEAFLFVKTSPNFWGVGPGVGLQAEVPLCLCGLSLRTEVGINALIGKEGHTHNVFKTEPTVEEPQTGMIRWRECSRVVPLGQFALGFDYTVPCQCVCLHLFASYELHYLWGGIAYPPSAHGAQIGTAPEIQVINVGLQRQRIDIGFAGLTFGVGIEF